MISFEKKIFNSIKKITKKKSLLHPPKFTKEDITCVTKCIMSSYVSTRGEFTYMLENQIKRITKSKFAILTNSGTSALELALRVLGLQKDDEVIVPSLTFVGSVNAITHSGGIPNFVDSDQKNLGIDYYKLELYLSEILQKKGKFFFNKKTKRRVFAIMPVHTFGMPGDIMHLKRISKKYNFKIVEDASEALGSWYRNRHLGTFGHVGVISFNANKIVTTGGGGVILTNNLKYAKNALHFSTTSKVQHKWELKHNNLGWNTRMPALNASLAYSGLKNFKRVIEKKRILAARYRDEFRKIEGVNFFDERKGVKSNFWLNTIILENDKIKFKNKILNYCNSKGIECRPIWNLISDMDIYKKCPKSNLSNAKTLLEKIICIPSGLNIK